MACKTAIIATNVGGNKEILDNRKTSILIENHNEILESVNDLLSDVSFRDSIIQNAINEIQKYDWQNVGKKYLDLYNSLL